MNNAKICLLQYIKCRQKLLDFHIFYAGVYIIPNFWFFPPPLKFFFDFLPQILELKRHNFLIFILQCIIIPKMMPCKHKWRRRLIFLKFWVMVWWQWKKKSGSIIFQSWNILFLEIISHHFSRGENLWILLIDLTILKNYWVMSILLSYLFWNCARSAKNLKKIFAAL